MDTSLETPSPEAPAAAGPAQTAVGAPRATAAQLQAITARGSDVVVSAGAGSGKTYVLVERYMGLVREGTSPERILTITFTEKAAHEMRERIAKALAEQGYPDARRVIEGAWISTIHGFCSRLLRERALEAGVDPAFTVLPEVPAARVRRAAFLRAQRSFRAERPGLYDGLVERVRWGRDQGGASAIRRQVFALYEQLRAAGARPRRLAGTEQLHLDAIDLPRVQRSLEELAEAVRWLTGAVAAARKTAFLSRRGLAISEISARIGAAPVDVFRLELYRDLKALAKASSGGGNLAPQFSAVREAAERAAEAYAEGPARALGRGLEDLLRRFEQAFRALKAEESALDFTDLEERTRELLEGQPDVRADVNRRFDAVMVDEFQDTSELQQHIVDLVRSPGELFAVGDVKQSIYGFRHAHVRGLLELMQHTQADGGEVVDLDRSFRTRPEVLAYIDEVFQRLWSERESEVPHQPLLPGITFPPASRPCVELVVGRGESLARARHSEARAVAARLATIVEGAQLVGTNPLRQDAFGKPLRYRDCAILVPATTALPAYERALRERGVPYRVASGRGFYSVREVVDATKLLKVAGNVYDDLSLLALLRSPSIGLGDGSLLTLSRAGGSLYEALALADTLELQPGDVARAAGARELVDTLRRLRGRCSTAELLARGLELSGQLDGSLLRSGDVRGFANLQKLISVVEGLERDGVTGPAAVAAVLDDLRASDARESEANVSADDEDAVSVLTVHGSKGLEWPLVVVADVGRGQRPEKDPMLWSAETGVTLNLRDPDGGDAVTPASLRMLWERGQQARREESKRLLYVAMTRARDHLILAGAQSHRARSGGDWLVWCRSPLSGSGRALSAEADPAAGGQARAFRSAGDVLVRSLEIPEDLEGAPLEGPRGPAADARPVLDMQGCHALANYRMPGLPAVSPEVEAKASALQERVRNAELPPLDQSPSVTTVSEVLTWMKCPRRFLLEHVVGDTGQAPSSPGGGRGESLPADVRGTLAHEAVARSLQGPKPTLRWAVTRLEQLLLPATAPQAHVEDAARRALHLARRFADSPLGQDALARSTSQGAIGTQVELPFLVGLDLGLGESEPLLLRGTVDLLVPTSSGWVLADHKAAEITALEVPGRLATHRLQLQLYALALEHLGYELAEAVLVYLVPEVVTAVNSSPVSLEEARETLRAFAEARRSLDLPATPSSACRHCPWHDACPDAERSSTKDRPHHDLALAPTRS